MSYGNIRRTQKANEQLNNFCDPEPMLCWAKEELDCYIRSGRARKQRDTVNVLAINQATALYALGRYEEAWAVLRKVDPEAKDPRTRLAYYINAAALSIRVGQLTVAETALEKVQELLAGNEKLASLVPDILIQYRMELAIAKGETCGVEEELLSLLGRATVEYARVSRHNTLARLYLKEGRFPAAREHLEYVVAHGNKLYARKEAEELLRTLPVEEDADLVYP